MEDKRGKTESFPLHLVNRAQFFFFFFQWWGIGTSVLVNLFRGQKDMNTINRLGKFKKQREKKCCWREGLAFYLKHNCIEEKTQSVIEIQLDNSCSANNDSRKLLKQSRNQSSWFLQDWTEQSSITSTKRRSNPG